MKNVFFIGIGGIHMNGMARLMKEMGMAVSGSDAKKSEITELLEKNGIEVFIGHNAEHITTEIDTVVYTAAVPANNPELVKARELGLEVMERAVALGDIMKGYQNVVCVSGCHGKTTTTSMLTDIFTFSGLNPTCIVGGKVPSIDDSLRIGAEKYFIAESCEYYDAFLRFLPTVGVILNVELDHVDYFGTLERVRESFRRFAAKIPLGGALIINAEIDDVEFFTNAAKCEIITFGSGNNCDWGFENVVVDNFGCAAFDVLYRGSFFWRVKLAVAGEHHIYNALAALAAYEFLGRNEKVYPMVEEVCRILSKSKGAKRRFEFKGNFNGAAIFDDYSHHPTEVRATVKTGRKMEKNKLWCVFQPHTKRRTREHFDDFAAAFDGADRVILVDIYNPSGRDDGTEVTSAELAEKIGENCTYCAGFDEAVRCIGENIEKGDLLITMGAGNIFEIADLLVAQKSY